MNNSSQTKNKTFVDENGYYRFSNLKKLVHRWVIEDYLGIKLKKHQIVHHINGNKLDNRPENLRVFLEPSGKKKHNNLHICQKENTGNWHGNIKCSCGTWNQVNYKFCKKCRKKK